MRSIIIIILIILFCSSIVSSQELNREQQLQKIDKPNNQIKVLEETNFLPSDKDLQQAENEGFEVFRILPRERSDRKSSIQGGGAFYSFTTKSHDYQKISQIMLEEDYLVTGFAGADYGLIADLGSVPLSSVTQTSGEVSFLYNYRPPTKETEARIEQHKSHNYETETATYRRRVFYSIGHSYAVRTIDFERADVLVAFKVHRKDADGSLIIFWKLLENFDKPTLERNSQ